MDEQKRVDMCNICKNIVVPSFQRHVQFRPEGAVYHYFCIHPDARPKPMHVGLDEMPPELPGNWELSSNWGESNKQQQTSNKWWP
jgi:hypothetical protein